MRNLGFSILSSSRFRIFFSCIKYLFLFCFSPSSFSAPLENILKSGTAGVASAGDSLNLLSQHLLTNLQNFSSFLEKLKNYFALEATDLLLTELGIWNVALVQGVKLLGVLIMTILCFLIIRRFVFYINDHHVSEKGLSLDTQDRVLMHVITWILFLIIGNIWADLFFLAPLFHDTLMAIFFIISTIIPIRKAFFLLIHNQQPHKSNKFSEQSSPILKLVKIFFIFGIISIGLILFSSFAAPFLIFKIHAVEPFFHIHWYNPVFIFSEKFFLYLYSLVLALFVLEAEKFAEPQGPRTSFTKLLFLQYYWMHHRRYWNYATQTLLVLTFFTFVGSKLKVIPVHVSQFVLACALFLFILTTRTLSNNILRYISLVLSRTVLPLKIRIALNGEKTFLFITHGIYYFLCICTFLYIWGKQDLLLSVKHEFFGIFEKVILIFLLVFLTAIVNSFLLSVIKKILNTRTEKEVSERIGNRLYTFLNIFQTLLGPILWIPVLSLILILFGISGKVILMIFAAIAAIFVWVGQGLMQDMIKGILYMLEDIVVIGEEVTLNNTITGRIERLSLHSISIRDFGGLLHTYSFGQITSIASSEWKFVNLVLDAVIEFDSDLEKAIHIMKKIITDMQETYEGQDFLSEQDLEVHVEDFIEHGIHLKARIKIKPGMRGKLKTLYYRNLKKEFDKNNIKFAETTPSPKSR